MKQFKTFQFWMAVLCLETLVASPILVNKAQADDAATFHALCDGDALSDNPKTSGPALVGACTKAKLASDTVAVEKAKEIIYGVAFATTAALALTDFISAGTTTAICTGVSLGATAGGYLENSKAAAQDAKTVGAFNTTAEKIMGPLTAITTDGGAIASSMGGSGSGIFGIILGKAGGAVKSVTTSLGKNLAPTVTADATDAAKQEAAKKGAAKAGCAVTAAMMGLQLGLTLSSKSAANDALHATVSDAQSVATPLAMSGVVLNQNGTTGPNNNVAAPVNNVAGRTSGSCATLSCISSISPEVAALTNSPAFVDNMQKLTGQSLDSLVAAGNAAPAGSSPVAAALGVGGDAGSAVAKLADSSKGLAQQAGIMDAYQPTGYARVSGSKASVGGSEFDFSKMMNETLKSLNPEAAKDGKSANTSELVFRQLDLLPPEKIEQNTEISLFARVGYRYRKNSDKVDSLNWAASQNQSAAPARAPASASQ